MFYQNNFGMLTPFVSTDLLDWADTVGEELVVEAMKRALERNRPTWSYVKGILTDWKIKRIRTVEQLEAAELAYRRRREENRRKGVEHQENVPDWFRKRKENQKKEKVDTSVEAGNKEEVDAMLKGYLQQTN